MKDGRLKLISGVCLAVSVCVPSVVAAQTKGGGDSQTIVVRGKWVWDGTSKPAIPEGIVLIRGDRIVAVGTEKEVKVPPDSISIDHRDLFLMPGLVDAHNHFSMDQYAGVGVGEGELMTRSAGHLALRAARNGRTALRSGVTTARVPTEIVKGPDYIALDYARAFNEDLLPGPRCVAAGHKLHPPSQEIFYPADTGSQSGVEELRRVVREDIRAGANFCKMFIGANIVPGPGENNNQVDAVYFTKEEINAVIEECHRHGQKVTAHVLAGGPSFEAAVAAGIDSFEHGILFTRTEMQELKDHNIFLVLTGNWLFAPEGRDLAFFQPYYGMLKQTRYFYTSTGRISAPASPEDILRNWYSVAFSVHPKLAVGADGLQDPGSLAKEVAVIVRYGHITNEEALLIATRNGGELTGLPVGTLEPDKYADVIGIQGNPLEDIKALQHIGFVMKGGKVYNLSEQ